MSVSIINDFNKLIADRMTRFQFLIAKAGFESKPYQTEGVKWCIENELRPNPPGNVRGGFIADEMGLGKTITMIGVMFANYLKRTLIVVPPPLIQQWINEIHRTTGHRCLMYYGTQKTTISVDILEKSPIVITSYNALLSDKCPLKSITWSRVIFDEAHHLRNENTKRYRSSKKINARVRWLVSGTPIQNSKKDFVNLCCAAGIPSSLYLDPLNLDTIRKHFILRRTKQQVGIEIPNVNQYVCTVEWQSDAEREFSEEIHSLLRNQTMVSSKKRKMYAESLGRGGTLIAMLRARQSCIMPKLMSKSLKKLIKRQVIGPEYALALKNTSKLCAVVDLMLSRKQNGKGKIVFCHFQNEIDFIACKLREGGMEKVVTYDGRNSGGQNLATLAEPADALVIQIQTGCEGLNLQKHFSEVYFVSPNWNPYIEDQAVARCHRIGQVNETDVFRFQMSGFEYYDNGDGIIVKPRTLESYIERVQKVKREIGSKILDGTTEQDGLALVPASFIRTNQLLIEE